MHTHPTVDELYAVVKARIPRISLGTVYRNLDFLTETGKVVKLSSAGTMRRFDGNITPHRHIFCKVCGRVADVSCEASPCALQENVRVPGFMVTAVRVEYDGICEECLSRSEKSDLQKQAS